MYGDYSCLNPSLELNPDADTGFNQKASIEAHLMDEDDRNEEQQELAESVAAAFADAVQDFEEFKSNLESGEIKKIDISDL